MGLFSDCKQMVKYSGRSIEIGTFKGPVQVPIEIGGVKVKPQLLQATGEILQILDWLQYSACQKIHALRKLKDIPHEIIANLILKQDQDHHMIASLAILSIAMSKSVGNFEHVLADWIAAALPRVPEAPNVGISESDRKEALETKEELANLGKKIKTVSDKIKRLRVQLKEMVSIKNNLENQKDKLQMLSLSRMTIMLPPSPIIIDVETPQIGLELPISEAIEAYPYLSQAIEKKKPFDVEMSLKLLTSDL